MVKVIDLTGQKFGKLTVVENAGKDKRGKTIWKCECDCGNTTIVRGDQLKSGNTSSCGCAKFKESLDLTGKQFGRLTVIKQVGEGKSGKTDWLCKCECGNEVVKSRRYLLRGQKCSCGCRTDNLKGKRFGRLIAIEKVDNKGKRGVFWLCKCDCGNKTVVSSDHLKKGHTSSCGCYRREIPSTRGHGLTHTRLFNIWNGMKERCYNQNNYHYKYYGARGIKICDEWLGENGLINFYNWAMSNGYTDKLTIDRINVNGDYEPNNCRWETMLKQANNKRNTCYIEYNGVKKSIPEWSRETGLAVSCIKARVEKLGWSAEKALTTPSTVITHYYEHNGESHTIGEWAKRYDLTSECLRSRLKLGWDIEKALTTPMKIYKNSAKTV